MKPAGLLRYGCPAPHPHLPCTLSTLRHKARVSIQNMCIQSSLGMFAGSAQSCSPACWKLALRFSLSAARMHCCLAESACIYLLAFMLAHSK
eukprot:263727-Pelagomonas_calceolata.AAC.3